MGQKLGKDKAFTQSIEAGLPTSPIGGPFFNSLLVHFCETAAEPGSASDFAAFNAV
jgi:hypothetical protein